MKKKINETVLPFNFTIFLTGTPEELTENK